MSRPATLTPESFVPDVVGAHTTGFRNVLPHGEEFFDDDEDQSHETDPGRMSPEERLRLEIEHDLREQMHQQLEAMQREVDRRLDDFARDFEARREESERELRAGAAALALSAARRVIRREISLDADTIVRVVEEAVRGLAAGSRVALRVHPEDGEHLRSQSDLLEKLRVEEVIDDPTMEAGGCRIDAGGRSWDATLQTQQEVLEEHLRSILESV